MTATHTIAGHDLTLSVGRRYIACRPMATRGVTRFDVAIRDITDGWDDRDPARVVPGLDLRRANDLLAAFNNGKVSFAGRIWK